MCRSKSKKEVDHTYTYTNTYTHTHNIPDGADRVDLLGGFFLAFITGGFPLLDHIHLPHIPRGARVNHGLVRGKAHAIDMTTGIDIVKGIEDQRELLEVVQAEVGGLDVVVVRRDAGVGVESLHDLAGDDGLGLPHVAGTEEELAVEVGDVDGV